MPKPTQDQIDEELQKQEDEVYGTAYTDGDPEKFVDTEGMVEEVTGDEPEEGKPFSIADAVDEDEEAIAEGADNLNDPNEHPDEVPESGLEKIGQKEKYKEDASDE